MILLSVALFGLVVPNGMFIYWLLREYPGFEAAMQNKPAVALMIDAFMAVALLAWHFAAAGSSGHGSWRSRSSEVSGSACRCMSG